jgi:DNA-nicking Smr family endonuclease
MPGRKPGSSGAPPGGTSDDDLALWRHVTRDTRPLAKRPAKAKPETPAPAERPRPAPPPAKPKAPETTETKETKKPAPRPAPPVPDLAKGDVVGVDKRTVGRLKRGKLPVEGRLDLHGLSQGEAERALAAFLARSQQRGHRCVLVITGKGSAGGARSEDAFARPGVLRRMVPIWLNAPANRTRVLAFDEARAQHGGAGALYVLLKRARAD